MGGYRELFNASIADPTAFWADAARAVTWTREPQRVLDDSNPPFYRWFPDGELNTCANALDRHVDGGRADQPALIYDSPVTGSQRTYTYRELLDETARFAGALRGLGRRQGRPRRDLHADGPRGGDRDAGVRAARRGAFGGVRRVRRTRTRRAHRRRAAGRHRVGVVRHRADAHRRLQADARRRTRDRRARPARVRDPAARAAALRAARGPRPRLARADGRCANPSTRCRSPRPTRCTCSTPPAPPASRRASSATTAAMRWRCCGACATSTTPQPGEVYWAASDVGWVVGHSYIVYGAAAAGRDDRAVRRQAGRHPGRGRVLAGRVRARGQGVVHRADGDPRDQEGGPRGHCTSASTTCRR